MPTWLVAVTLVLLAWGLGAGFATAVIGRVSRVWLAEVEESPVDDESQKRTANLATVKSIRQEAEGGYPTLPRLGGRPLRVLVVDDDAKLRMLIRTSFEAGDIEVEEAESASAAANRVARWEPDVLVLDVAMPGTDGVTFCRALKDDPATEKIAVVLLTGADVSSAEDAGADALLRKPFSPLTLLATVERLGSGSLLSAPQPALAHPDDQQLLLYAQDFRRLVDLERGQRRLLETAYRETAVALAHALEAKDTGTGAHSERVRRYATELARAVDPSLLQEPSLEYGFILHDVGKIAIPDALLGKPGPLSPGERRVLESHPVLGEQMVGKAALLRGLGASVVRSHHERWDGTGYPDRLAGDDIPLGARIFSVADALDAMTSDRPYRRARGWHDAVDEIAREAGSQFDPEIVDLFRDREQAMRRVYYEVSNN